MAVTWLTPTEFTVGAASAWTDVDVSASVPSGATGVILHIVNNSASTRAVGWRKNGSTDNRTKNINNDSHMWVAVGVDGSRIFEAYSGNTTDIDIYLVGYFDSMAVFNTNAVDKSFDSPTNTWTDVNIASDTGADTGSGTY